MGEKKIHYSGGLIYKLRDGRTAQLSPGYPVCCCGPRAHKIRLDGNQTRDQGEVTCSNCLRMLERVESLSKKGASS